MLVAEKGVRGKGRQPFAPPQHTESSASALLPFFLKTSFRHAHCLPEEQFKSGSGPPVVPSGAIASILDTSLHNQQAAVGLILFTLINKARWLRVPRFVGPDINHARGHSLVEFARDRIPHKKIVATGTAGAGAENEMAGEIYMRAGIFGRIAAKTAQIGSLELVLITEIRWLHGPTIDLGNRMVFESRCHHRLAVRGGNEAACRQPNCY